VKDVLAEDHELGMALQSKGYHMYLCPTPVQNIQVHQSFRQFWGRHTRWAMIRFRVIFPIVLGEPVLNPIFLALIAALLNPSLPWGWGLFAAVAALTTAATQVCAILARGKGFKAWHLLLVPLRDLIFFAAWVRGGTMRWVNWRGNRLLVLDKTRLAAPTALSRARNIQRLSR
jgi:ceramide glucosyltransferase